MSPEITIRPARENEAAAVVRLWKESDATPSITDSAEEVTRLTREQGAVLLVATDNDQVVGSVIGGWDGWRGNIYRLTVRQDHRCKGLAKTLVQEVSRALFDKGARRLSALVEYEHELAVGFWDSMRDYGWVIDPRFVRYIKDRDVTVPR